MSKYKYLAVDFGAESGRVIAGILENDQLRLEEIHRFPNQPVRIHGRLHWNVLSLFSELKKGLSLAVEKGHGDIQSIGVDTWGVDFGLIDKSGQIVGNPVAYRDSRTDGMMEKAFGKMPREEIYQKTGIQFMQLNTIFQLLSLVAEKNPQLEIADHLLFMPDLFIYLLTGKKIAEYSIASTSQLLNAQTRTWADDVFSKLNLPRHLMPEIVPPGTMVGSLLDNIANEVGLGKVQVIAPAGHDTACAVAAIPAKGNNWAYLSSGTWSLIGIESPVPVINPLSLQANFTNEGGAFGKIRFLRNVMGLWLLQEARKSWSKSGKDFNYEELVRLADNAKPLNCIIDPDDSSFLNPPDMPKAIIDYCIKNEQPHPESKGEFVRCIFESLALKYRSVIRRINELNSLNIDRLYIVGGGSQNEMLNQFTADACGLPVQAGPVEATAIGNVIIQAIAGGAVKSPEAGRELVARSFPLKTFLPEHTGAWQKVTEKVSFI